MIKHSIRSIAAAATLVGLAACGGSGSDTTVQQDTTFTTVPRQDTIAVERQVEVSQDTVIDTRP